MNTDITTNENYGVDKETDKNRKPLSEKQNLLQSQPRQQENPFAFDRDGYSKFGDMLYGYSEGEKKVEEQSSWEEQQQQVGSLGESEDPDNFDKENHPFKNSFEQLGKQNTQGFSYSDHPVKEEQSWEEPTEEQFEFREKTKELVGPFARERGKKIADLTKEELDEFCEKTEEKQNTNESAANNELLVSVEKDKNLGPEVNQEKQEVNQSPGWLTDWLKKENLDLEKKPYLFIPLSILIVSVIACLYVIVRYLINKVKSLFRSNRHKSN